MKILIIGFAKIKYMPYLNLYLENLDRDKNDVHLIYWNRDLKQEDLSKLSGITLHEFRCYQEDDVKRSTKIPNFIKFRRFAKGVLKEEFDFVVSLHSVCSVLLSGVLTKKYKDRYIYDYRDITYESIPFYKNAVDRLVENSRATFVSSDAFRNFLQKKNNHKIFTTHNFLSDSLSYEGVGLNKVPSPKIRVAFWGFIRNEQVNLQLIQGLADDRFQLHFYGREQQTALNLKKYVEENNIDNVFFHGEYIPEERYEFAKNTDIIHNIYAESQMDVAMTNKYYDGIIFRIPQICTLGSFMGEQAEKNKVGKAINLQGENIAEEIFSYYTSLDREQFELNCEKTLSKVIADNKIIIEKIKGIF